MSIEQTNGGNIEQQQTDDREQEQSKHISQAQN